ncbi:MAG: hypothetical protein L0Z50_09860 [Verrucomicrobiales bacterium]|nr:hypothetical protein [Verrucomicrobiales bacterium]
MNDEELSELRDELRRENLAHRRESMKVGKRLRKRVNPWKAFQRGFRSGAAEIEPEKNWRFWLTRVVVPALSVVALLAWAYWFNQSPKEGPLAYVAIDPERSGVEISLPTNLSVDFGSGALALFQRDVRYTGSLGVLTNAALAGGISYPLSLSGSDEAGLRAEFRGQVELTMFAEATRSKHPRVRLFALKGVLEIPNVTTNQSISRTYRFEGVPR